MGVTKEAKIGVIGFVVLATVLFAFNYLNRKNVFSQNLTITVEFKNLDYIKKGEVVLIKGREAGKIVAIYKDGKRLLVDLGIEPDTKIPPTAKAVISELSLLGGRAISIVYEGTCTSNCLESGAVIQGSVYTMKEQVAESATPILKSIGNLADTIAGPNGMQQVLDNAYASLNSLRKTTDGAKGQLRGLNRSLPADIRGFRDLTAALLGATPNNSAAIAERMTSNRAMAMALDTLLNNLSSLSQVDIDSMTQLLYTAYDAAQKVPEQLKGARGMTTKANAVLDSLEESLKAYQEGAEGTVPKLLYSQAMRDSTQQSIRDLSKQIKAIRANPENYLSL
ncbi:MAG: MlaD family protein [Aureispira sp.]